MKQTVVHNQAWINVFTQDLQARVPSQRLVIDILYKVSFKIRFTELIYNIQCGTFKSNEKYLEERAKGTFRLHLGQIFASRP